MFFWVHSDKVPIWWRLCASEPATRMSTRLPHNVTMKSVCCDAKATGKGIPVAKWQSRFLSNIDIWIYIIYKIYKSKNKLQKKSTKDMHKHQNRLIRIYHESMSRRGRTKAATPPWTFRDAWACKNIQKQLNSSLHCGKHNWTSHLNCVVNFDV